MPPLLTPMLAAVLLLRACNGSIDGGLRLDPLPAPASAPCATPTEALSARDWEIIAGRLGDALIDCEGRRALAVAHYNAVREAVGPR